MFGSTSQWIKNIITQRIDRNKTVYTVWIKRMWIKTQTLPFFSNKTDAVLKTTLINETGIWKPSASALEVGWGCQMRQGITRMCCLGKMNVTFVLEEFCSLHQGHKLSSGCMKMTDKYCFHRLKVLDIEYYSMEYYSKIIPWFSKNGSHLLDDNLLLPPFIKATT